MHRVKIGKKKALPASGEKVWMRSYTLTFVLLSMIMYSLNIIYHKSFVYSGVNLAGDGLVQHYTALAYYGEYLRTIGRNFFKTFTFSIPEFDLSIGLGGSIITTLGYEVLGDPFNLLAAFVPMQYTEYLYVFLVILRLYLAGIAFCQYCFYHSFDVRQTLPGMIVYVFSFYTVALLILHPFFLNPLIYLPLVLLGVDKIFRERRPVPFIFSCTLSAVSNFYFFYMITIMVFLYCVPYLAGLLMKDRDWKKGLRALVRLGFCYIMSLMLAAPVFLPMAMAVQSSSRVGGARQLPCFYELIYYVKLPIAFMNASADHYAHLGYGIVAVLAVVMLFFKTKRKDRIPLKAAFITGTIFLLFPFFGSMMNGFGYATNRWVWAYGFAVAIIVVSQFPALLKMGRGMVWGAIGATLLCMIPTFYARVGGTREKMVSAAVILLLAAVLLCGVAFFSRHRENGAEFVLLAVMTVNMFLSMYSYYSPSAGDYLRECGDWGHAWQDILDGPLCVFEGMDEEKTEGVRVDTANMSMADVRINSAMLKGVNSIPFYFSMINGSSAVFLHEIQLPTPLENQYVSLDGRAILSSLLGVRYQIARLGEEAKLSYGYNSLVQERNGYVMYETENALPLAFFYDTIVQETDYNILDVVEKQQVMMQAAVIEDGDQVKVGDMPVMKTGEAEYCHWDSLYQIEDAQGVAIQNNRYEVTREGAFIQLRTDCSQTVERYFLFDNLWYEGADSARITVTDGVNACGLDVNSVTSNYYAGVHDFLCNMGYSEEHGGSYRITFSMPGIYSIDEIRIVDQPLERLDTWSSARRENEVTYSIGEDEILLQAEAKEESLLYLAVPYSEGWSAWIDGEKTPVMKVNHFGMGLYISQGEHYVCLKYHTPYLQLGLVMMVAGVIGCCAILGWERRKTLLRLTFGII